MNHKRITRPRIGRVAKVPVHLDGRGQPKSHSVQPHEKVKLSYDQTRALIDKPAEPPMIPGLWHGGKDWE
jgi:hypothetical protein